MVYNERTSQGNQDNLTQQEQENLTDQQGTDQQVNEGLFPADTFSKPIGQGSNNPIEGAQASLGPGDSEESVSRGLVEGDTIQGAWENHGVAYGEPEAAENDRERKALMEK